MTVTNNARSIRELIVESFDDAELTRFCNDYFPEARGCMGSGMNLETKAYELVDYFDRRGTLGRLVEKLREERPKRFTTGPAGEAGSGGAKIIAKGDLSIGGDVVGRDKINITINNAGTSPAASPSAHGSGVDFVVVTALPEEREALLHHLPGYKKLPPIPDDIHVYFQADLPITFPGGAAGTYRLMVMCLAGMGRVKAATATSDAIRRWHPPYVLLVGIAGGIAARDVCLGDVLIADQIVDYELQRLTPQGPQVRWEVHRADPRLLEASSFQDERWQNHLVVQRPGPGKVVCHTGPVASGDKVVAFGEVLAAYAAVWPKLLGVEMEAAGAATAAFQSPDQPGFFMVRSVSDLADEDKGSNTVKSWRSYACDVAASFAIALLRSGPVPLSESEVKRNEQA